MELTSCCLDDFASEDGFTGIADGFISWMGFEFSAFEMTSLGLLNLETSKLKKGAWTEHGQHLVVMKSYRGFKQLSKGTADVTAIRSVTSLGTCSRSNRRSASPATVTA